MFSGKIEQKYGNFEQKRKSLKCSQNFKPR